MWLGDLSKVTYPVSCTARTQTQNPSPAPISLHHRLLPSGQSALKMGTFATVHIGYIFLLLLVSDAAEDDASCLHLWTWPHSPGPFPTTHGIHIYTAAPNKSNPRPLRLKFWRQCRHVGKIRKCTLDLSYSNPGERSVASHLNLSRSIIVNKEALVLSGESGYTFTSVFICLCFVLHT